MAVSLQCAHIHIHTHTHSSPPTLYTPISSGFMERVGEVTDVFVMQVSEEMQMYFIFSEITLKCDIFRSDLRPVTFTLNSH